MSDDREWTTGKELGPRYEPTQLIRNEKHVATVWGSLSETTATEMALKLNAHDDMLAELRRLEWGACDDDECPRCGGLHPDIEGSGHRPGCPLAAAIARAEGGSR